MGLPDFGPTPHEIDQRTARIVAAAVRVKGERELRMIPNGHPDQAKYAGRHHSEFQGRGTITPKNNFVPIAVDAGGHYLGTPQQWKELEAEYDWIPRVFRMQLDADPRNFSDLIGAAKRLTEGLVSHSQQSGMPQPEHLPQGSGAVDQPIAMALGKVGDWNGNFAAGFQNYLHGIPPVTRRQDALAQALHYSAEAARDIYAGARVVLGDIANGTLTALESAEGSGHVSKNGLNIVFGILSGAAGIVSGALALKGLSTAGNVWNIIAGASSGLSSAANLLPESKPVDVAADTVDGILSKMNQALRVHRTTLSDMEETYARKLGELVRLVDSNTVGGGANATAFAFFPKRPQALDMKTGLKDLKDHQTGFTHAAAY